MDPKAFARSTSLAKLIDKSKLRHSTEFTFRSKLSKTIPKNRLDKVLSGSKLKFHMKKKILECKNKDFTESEVETIFNCFDIHKTGEVNPETIYTLLNGTETMQEIQKTFEILKNEANKTMTYQEFYLLMNS